MTGHKRVVNTLVRASHEGSALTAQDVERMRDTQRAGRDSQDAREGRAAFAEKRKPVFVGR